MCDKGTVYSAPGNTFWRHWLYRVQVLGALTGALLGAGEARAASLSLAIVGHSTNGGASMWVQGLPGHEITLEFSTNLQQWTAFQTNVLSANGTSTQVDGEAAGLAARFYRAWDSDAGGSYASNVVGVVTIEVPIGRTLIANPFLAADQRIGALWPAVPHGIALYKVGSDGERAVNNFLFGWSDADMALWPGEGALVDNPSGDLVRITFFGEVVQGVSTNRLGSGQSFCSSVISRAAALVPTLEFPTNDPVAVTLGFCLSCDEHAYDPARGQWTRGVPDLHLGEGFWLQKLMPGEWVQTLTVTHPRSVGYAVANDAFNPQSAQVNFFTYAAQPGFGRVFDTDGTTPLNSAFSGQLYAGSDSNEVTLAAVGAPASFQSGFGAGYIRSGLVAVPGEDDPKTWLQLRVWETGLGSSYETARANGSKAGSSEIFSVQARQLLLVDPPPPANGFANFNVTHGMAPGVLPPIIRVNGELYPDHSAAVAGPVQVSMETTPADAHIFYTLDGTEPAHGILYVGRFALNHSATIRAVGYAGGSGRGAEGAPVQVTLLTSPAIYRQPTDLLLPMGAAADFAVQATGTDPLHYQWRFNGVELGDATNAALVLPAVQFADDGGYSVVVTNLLGATTSAIARLAVWALPSVTVRPGATHVPLGGALTFVAEASGTPPLAYQWRKNAVNIPGATNGTLALPEVELADGGEYSVVVANAVGAVTSAGALLLVQVPTSAGPPGDSFAERIPLGTNQFAAGTNTAATAEANEPRHAGKFGTNSVWYSWVAPADGIATFGTRGSTFDTLLAVYSGSSLEQLKPVAGDEDGAGFLTSEARFNAVANTEYPIAVDGFAGQRGAFILGWTLEPTNATLPVITREPLSLTATQGQEVTFSVTVADANVGYQWYFNSEPRPGASHASLVLPQATRGDVGVYSVVVAHANGLSVTSQPAVLELGSEPGTVSQDKLEDLIFPGAGEPVNVQGFAVGSVIPEAAYRVGAGTIAYHWLSNTNSTTSPNEDNHCGQIINASRWLFLMPTNAGTLVLDTGGSEIATILAAYAYDVDLGLRLPPIACATNNVPDQFAERRWIEATPGTIYAVALDGLRRQVGHIQLNWALGEAPVIAALATNYHLIQGSTLVLEAGVLPGIPSPIYQWRHNERAVPDATQEYLILEDLQPEQSGAYSVTVSNAIGEVTRFAGEVEVNRSHTVLTASSFEQSAEQWYVDGGATDPVHQITGGNPGGWLSAQDQHLARSWYWVAPPPFLGDQRPAYGGWLQFDLWQSVFVPSTESCTAVILEDTNRVMLRFEAVVNPGPAWTTYRIPLREQTGWRDPLGRAVTRGELMQVLSALSRVRILGEYSDAPATVGLDNVAFANATPWLAVQPHAEPGWVAIEWPVHAWDYTLEAAANLDQAEWTQVPVQEEMVGPRRRVLLQLGPSIRFFRLKWTP